MRQQARELNPHVPDYLTGRKAPPEQRPAYILFGEETEAIDYAAGHRTLGERARRAGLA